MEIVENKVSYEESIELYKSFQPASLSLDILPPDQAENETFDEKFPGNLIQKPQYFNCDFHKSKFNSANGAYSKLQNCNLFDCKLINCDFRYGDFTYTKFVKCSDQMKISSCNFSFSNFIGNVFNDVAFSGTSFRQMKIADCSFINSVITNSSFEETVFHNCNFKNINFKDVGVRFCEFSECTFTNITFPILDLASNIGLIDLLQDQYKQVTISLGTNGTTTLAHALKLLYKLIPYYYKSHQYFQIINILLIHDEKDKIWNLLHEAFNYTISVNDFPALLSLCNLIVKLKVFNSEKLRVLYNRIIENVIPENLPYHLLKSYLSYIKNIQNLLLDNPSQYPKAQFILETDIDEKNRDKLISVIDDLENVISQFDTNISSTIQLTHHSPYELILFICAEMPLLLQICQTFYYTFGGIKSLQDISGSKHEKTKNIKRTSRPSNKGTDNKELQNSVNIDLKIGGMNFSFHKETIKHVKSTEYFIT